jgi:anaerobic selenocysteine-containing dehydrogenase
MCPMNCHPTFCGMLVDVEAGRVVGVRGDKENPDSQGFLCVRGAAAGEIVYNPKRIHRPLMRKGPRGSGEWEEISWTAALEAIADRMKTVGREAVAVFPGHGSFVNGLNGPLVARFANAYGCQWLNPSIVCWALGGWGLAVTGVVETHSKSDLAEHSRLILLWGANLASQPTLGPSLLAAKRRGAQLITIDVRESEAAELSDRFLPICPATDTALALAMMHVIIGERLHDPEFVASHTVGFESLAEHVRQYSPEWAAPITGIPAGEIRELARRYATTKPAMIVLGGSSMFKSGNGWTSSRAIACLPALVGQLGVAGGGLGPRHRGTHHGEALVDIRAMNLRPPGDYIPSHMPAITQALLDGKVKLLCLFGTNMLSSFADSNQLARGLERVDLIVAHDLFLQDTARLHADFVLPGTSWVEELGFKSTNTHVYLTERVIDPLGEARPVAWILRELARRLGFKEKFWPWPDTEGAIDAILAHPSTGHVTVAELRAGEGWAPFSISPIAHPNLHFPTPSGKVEFYSERAAKWGLSPLPTWEEPRESERSRPELAARYPLTLRFGRTLTHFHSFYLSGQALPTLAKKDPEPRLWISLEDAAARGIRDGGKIRAFNDRGEMLLRAYVTPKVKPGVVWSRDGWRGLNGLASNAQALPVEVTDVLPIPSGQAAYEALVEVAPAE